MRGRFTIIHYQMFLKGYSIGSHLCTNMVMIGISFSFLKVLFDYISVFKQRQIWVLWLSNSYMSLPSLFYHF